MPDLLCRRLICSYYIRPTHVLLMQWRNAFMRITKNFLQNLERVGNLSSASIPVLLDELNRQGKLHRGDRIVLAGFGAGLTIGACVMTW